MIDSYIIPQWFLGFDIVMQILFCIISLAVAALAFKIYKISNERKIKYFSWGFLLIAIAYIIQGTINLFLVSEIAENHILNMAHMQFTSFVGISLSMLFFISGLITIFYANISSNKKESYYLLLGLGLLAVFTNINDIAAFHIASAFVLIFINIHYLKDYLSNKNKKTLFVMIAFLMLFLSHIVFIFPVNYPQYVIAHLIELGSYVFILISLVKNLKIKPTRKIP